MSEHPLERQDVIYLRAPALLRPHHAINDAIDVADKEQRTVILNCRNRFLEIAPGSPFLKIFNEYIGASTNVSTGTECGEP